MSARLRIRVTHQMLSEAVGMGAGCYHQKKSYSYLVFNKSISVISFRLECDLQGKKEISNSGFVDRPTKTGVRVPVF